MRPQIKRPNDSSGSLRGRLDRANPLFFAQKSLHFGVLALVFVALTGCVRNRQHVEIKTYPYHLPLASPGAKFSAMPAAAQNSVRAEAGAVEISDIRKFPTDGLPIYAVYFRNPGINPPLYVALNGDVLYPDLGVAVSALSEQAATDTRQPVSGLRILDLPPEVVQRIRETAPMGEITTINKQVFGSRTVYEIIFRDETQHPRLHIGQDGILLQY